MEGLYPNLCPAAAVKQMIDLSQDEWRGGETMLRLSEEAGGVAMPRIGLAEQSENERGVEDDQSSPKPSR